MSIETEKKDLESHTAIAEKFEKFVAAYAASHGLEYRTALLAVQKLMPELAEKYAASMMTSNWIFSEDEPAPKAATPHPDRAVTEFETAVNMFAKDCQTTFAEAFDRAQREFPELTKNYADHLGIASIE